jgi:ABC-type maltose transport system permease subunit
VFGVFPIVRRYARGSNSLFTLFLIALFFAACADPTIPAHFESGIVQGVYGLNWPVLAAGVLMMAIPIVVLFLFLQRYIISGLTQGSLSGQ